LKSFGQVEEVTTSENALGADMVLVVAATRAVAELRVRTHVAVEGYVPASRVAKLLSGCVSPSEAFTIPQEWNTLASTWIHSKVASCLRLR